MNLVYLAKPIYGGWINFTVHLSLLTGSPIYKTTKRSEKKKRNFGFDLQYQNLSIDDCIQLKDIIIVALDKHYYQYLHRFPKHTKLVIHDPTEIKNKNNPLIQDDLLNNFSIITIRKTVQTYLQTNYQIESQCIHHPFYQYPRPILDKQSNFAVSISRIDFDKHIDIILKANLLLPETKKIQIYGKENRLYVHHKLKQHDFKSYWKGKYDKQLQIVYQGKDILQNSTYMIDLSTIHNDGGGTQYTFLDGIYNDCVLILHKQWIDKGTLFQHGFNCLAVQNEQELIELLTNQLPESKLSEIRKNALHILNKCNVTL